MRVDRRLDLRLARLHVGQEVEEPRQVVALGEAFARHQSALFEHGVGEEKAVGRHERDPRMALPAREERLEHARRRAFSRRHAPGQADDEGHLVVALAQEVLGLAVQALRGLDIEIEQAAQRQIDVDHFIGRDPLGQAREILEVRLGERHRRVGPQPRPFRARIDRIRREGNGGPRVHGKRPAPVLSDRGSLLLLETAIRPCAAPAPRKPLRG